MRIYHLKFASRKSATEHFRLWSIIYFCHSTSPHKKFVTPIIPHIPQHCHTYIYAKIKEECETRLAEIIKEMKAEIQTEKERLKQEQSM